METKLTGPETDLALRLWLHRMNPDERGKVMYEHPTMYEKLTGYNPYADVLTKCANLIDDFLADADGLSIATANAVRKARAEHVLSEINRLAFGAGWSAIPRWEPEPGCASGDDDLAAGDLASVIK